MCNGWTPFLPSPLSGELLGTEQRGGFVAKTTGTESDNLQACVGGLGQRVEHKAQKLG